MAQDAHPGIQAQQCGKSWRYPTPVGACTLFPDVSQPMQADAINTVLNLSSAIHDLSRATEHATGEERRRVHSTISRLLQVIDDVTGKPAVSEAPPVVMGSDLAVLGAERYGPPRVVVRLAPSVQGHVPCEAPIKALTSDEQPVAQASDIDAELAALLANLNEREDAALAESEQIADELRAVGIPQTLRIALREHGVTELQQLIALTWRDLSDLHRVGLAGASIIRRKLLTAGHALATVQAAPDDLVPYEQNPSTVDLGIHPELIHRLETLRIYDLDDLCRVGRAVLQDDQVIGDLGAAALAQKARNFGRELAA